MNRTLMRAGALAGAATLATVTAAPGYAATVSQGTASAITIDIAGQGAQDSGKVTATNDGSGQQKTGMSEPPAPAIPSGGTLNFGVLAQDATADVVKGKGSAAACAGIAGNDGSVLQVGEGFCLTPGDDATLDLGLGSLENLPDVEIPPAELDSILEQFTGSVGSVTGRNQDDATADGGTTTQDGAPEVAVPDAQGPDGKGPDAKGPASRQSSQQDSQPREQLEQKLTPDAPGAGSGTSGNQNSSAAQSSGGVQNASYQPSAADLPAPPELSPEQVQQAIEDAVAGVTDQIGPLGLTGSFGAIQAICNAGPGLSGDANLANASLKVQGGGQTLGLLDLPANPAPNTHLTTDLSDVVDLVIEDLKANLNEQLAPGADALTQVQEQALDDVVEQVQSQLGPLEQNVLDVTLNKQTRSNGTIHVTALDAQVLPAAKEQLGASLVSLQLGDVTCGAGNVSGPGPVAGVTQQNPQVPTVVTAGEQGGSEGGLPAGVVGGILALLGATGLVGYRRIVGR